MPAKNALFLFLGALIWGTAFVAQSEGMNYLGPLTFNGIRSLMGSVVLLPVILIRRRSRIRQAEKGEKALYDFKTTLKGGICCGIFLFAASNLQQTALQYVEVGKAGFMTTLYIVLVPVFYFFITRKTQLRVWIGVLLAVAGLYLLCITDTFRLEKADILLILCALFFAGQILSIDHFTAMPTDPVEMSSIEFLLTGILSVVIGLATEEFSFSAVAGAAVPLIYAGVFSSGIAYTFQMLGQKGADPTIASLIMSLESVISLLAGFVLLHQVLSGRELIGCVLMFAAIILVQLPGKENAACTENS